MSERDRQISVQHVRDANKRLAAENARLTVEVQRLRAAATLTDAERETLRGMLPTIMYEPDRRVIESILERLRGER